MPLYIGLVMICMREIYKPGSVRKGMGPTSSYHVVANHQDLGEVAGATVSLLSGGSTPPFVALLLYRVNM